MYQVIARKYRPAQFSELIGQEHVRTTLENAITQRRIAHGYILGGQRGTGKTTVARIIGRCLNCIQGPTPQPCGVCSSCIEIAAGNSVDVIEIDAASNRGINEMRELRENVRYRPARDLYKVFIIDEAHQITTEAFNALLKTLEEPPEYAVFILCTTEVHKIPTTIISRCQQFSFRSVDFGQLVARMRWICEQEGIKADEDVLSVLALAGEGSVRDSLSALDQAIACCGTTLDSNQLRELLGVFSIESLQLVTDALAESSPAKMFEVVQELERNGHSLQHFCRELARYFRNLLVAKIAGKPTHLISASDAEQVALVRTALQFSEQDLTRYLQVVLDVFKDLQASQQPRLHLEIGLLKLIYAGRLGPIEDALASLGGAPRQAKPQAAAPQPSAGPALAPARTGPSPFERDLAKKAAPPSAPAPAAPELLPAREAEPATGGGDWKEKIYAALVELGMPFTADAVEHSDVTEQGGELQFVTPKEFKLSMSAADLQKAAQQAAGRAIRVKVVIGNASTSPAASPARLGAVKEDEVEKRALSHPGVQKFKELFPDSQIRAVRNLKE